MAPRKKPVPAPEPEPPTRILEGFDWHRTPDLRSYGGVNLKEAPAVFNGTVYVYRYRATVERIEEPAHIIAARIVALYLASDNPHHRTALAQEARRVGFDIHAAVEAHKEKDQ